MGGLAKLKEDRVTVVNKWSPTQFVNYTGLYDFSGPEKSHPEVWQQSHWSYASVALHLALQAHPIQGQRGVIFGSDGQSPWVENFAMKHGAERLLIIEQQRVISDAPRLLQYVTPLAVAQNYDSHVGRYDFVISFAQLGPLGLGGGGEIQEPYADISAIFRLACLLKKEGTMYLGEAMTRDGVNYNTRRIYGRIRLPLLLAGFEIRTGFLNNQATPIILDPNWLDTEHTITYVPVLVLQKKW
ncbi:unnamed protein product, partial [Mesorhabditis spiculigera]